MILPVLQDNAEYAREVQDKLRAKGIRAEMDLRNEKIGYRIREAQLQKVPYMLVIGEKEAASGTVAVRSRKEGELGTISVEDLSAKLAKENADRI
jgi:threonyl-tRNA synthetase